MRILVALLAALLALSGAAANARDVALAPQTCVGGATSEPAALALPEAALNCSDNRFLRGERFVRLHTDLAVPLPGDEDLFWVTDPSQFDSLLLRFEWDDGQQRLVRIRPDMVADYWVAPLHIAVPVPERAGRRLVAIDTVVQAPRTLAVMRDARIADRTQVWTEHYRASLIAVLTIGMLLVPVFHTLIFYRLLRAPFILWHAGMATAMAIFVLAHSGLIFSVFPSLPLGVRWQLISGAFVVSIICAAFFTTGLLERGTLPAGWRRLVLLALVPPVIAKLVLIADLEALRPYAGRTFPFSYIPLMAILPAALVQAIRRGSRAARFTLFGFGVVALAGAGIMFSISGVLHSGSNADTLLRIALVAMSLATSAAVADRFMVLRMQLDRERTRAARLGAMAYTDALTGLANRRAFDTSPVLREGYGLVIADLDHFKRINDEGGHDAGDEALVRVSGVLRQVFADCPQATTYRLGGEEFGVIVPADGLAELARSAEALRHAFECDPGTETVGWAPTASVGAVLGNGQALADAFTQADRAMYRAKRLGRNRCEIVGMESADEDSFGTDVWERVRSRI